MGTFNMISIILLLEECYKDQSDFITAIDRIFSELGTPYEILIVANGTGNFFRSLLPEIQVLSSHIRAFELGSRTTQAVCLKAVLKEVQADTVVICGSYQQLTDESIREVVDALDESCDVVSPWRQKRVDPAFNQFQSRVFNWLMRWFVGTEIHDFSCTVKVVRRTVLDGLELYGNMFRFLPVLAASRGFRVKEVPVKHLQERGKIGFYSLSEYITRLIDMFTLFFNTRFTRKPLRFFSTIGIGFSSAGTLSLLVLFIQRFFFGIPIGNRPFLFLSLLLIIIGVLVSSAGLLGEIIAFTNGRQKKEYTVDKTIG
jgi:hypothetical protein